MSIKQKRSLCSFLILAALALSAYAFDLAARGSALKAVTAARDSMTNGRQTETLSGGRPVQNIRFALYDAAIYPREARVGSGHLIISLVDYTAAAVGLVVERDTDQVRQNVGPMTSRGVRWRGRQELDLSPGTYRLYDASHPENQAMLIVEP